MMFDKLCVEKILKGEKTVTRRIKRNNRRPAIPGKVHKIKVDRTDKTYGYIYIQSCTIENTIWPVSHAEAMREGFDNAFDFQKYWLSKNKPYNDEPIWRVEFDLIVPTIYGDALINGKMKCLNIKKETLIDAINNCDKSELEKEIAQQINGDD